ncbi:hypothetical protein C2G38_2059226, partial [Gigaspora rosea]
MKTFYIRIMLDKLYIVFEFHTAEDGYIYIYIRSCLNSYVTDGRMVSFSFACRLR